MIDLQPTLSGQLVLLRPLYQKDWEALYGVASDPEIWAQHPSFDRYQRPVFQTYFDEAMASGGAFAIIDHASGAMIGSTRFANYRAEKNEIEIGWTFYARSHWRTGHNRDVKRLMLNYIFPLIETVVFRIGQDNLRSRAAVERLGAVLDGGSLERIGDREIAYVRYILSKQNAAIGALELEI